MRSIIKSLIEFPSSKKLSDFDQIFYQFFRDRDESFDGIITFIRDYFAKFAIFPDFDAFKRELSVSGESKLLDYITEIFDDSTIPSWESEIEFISNIKVLKELQLSLDIQGAAKKFQADLGQDDIQRIDDQIITLHQIKSKAIPSGQGTSSLLYGPEAAGEIERIYDNIQLKKEDDQSLYYTLGFPSFDRIQVKRGDMIFIGGFTSHGKSILLRTISYRLLTTYGLNVLFISFEMSYEVVRIIFAILHANNKEVFPNTPPISYNKFKVGELTEEEKDFLFNVAEPDFVNNFAYGTLALEQPEKSAYNMVDLSTKVVELESSVMPIHVTVLDYLTLMRPNISERATPQRSDYNQLIKDFKSMGLTHRDARGQPAPMITMTAAQISRAGLSACIKNDNHYEIDAYREYSEIEGSSDILLTTLITDEMLQASLAQLQNLKNRDGGIVVDPVQVHVEFEYGFSFSEISSRSEEEVVEALKTLNL